VGKVYNIWRVKTDISVVLTVRSDLDPHTINKLEDEINHGPCLWSWLCFCYIFSVSFNVGLVCTYTSMLIKYNQLKLLIAVSQSTFSYFCLHII
jgi:hypothetical protein